MHLYRWVSLNRWLAPIGVCCAVAACSAAGEHGPNNFTSGGGGSSGASNGGGGTAPGAGSSTLPARVRRLSNAEYDASVRVLLGSQLAPTVEFSFPPDAKQGPSNSPAGAAFTVNDAQRVDPVLADKLDTAAQALVAEARQNGRLDALAPCSDTSAAGGAACAKTFIETVGAQFYRRPLVEAEVAGLLTAYHVGADGFTHAEGIDLVLRVLLQSPGFLYLTEIGAVGSGASFVMTAEEIAASLSYLLTAEPPDATLLAAGAGLTNPDVREAEARRLLATPAGRERFVRVVREWLGIDHVARREKAQTVYPEFAGLSHAMEQESRDFIEEVLVRSTGTLTELLTADWTIADPALAMAYGVSPAAQGERTQLGSVKRRGILSQGAFLSVFATNGGSHPVFRGVALMRRIACLDIPDPGALGIVVSFPAADSSKTTRARFEAHALDEACASCHKTIDNLGFAFEAFDGIGKERTSENGLPIDTSVSLAAAPDLTGDYADHVELLTALAQSESVKSCLARQLFRSTAARSDQTVRDAEEAFVATWQQLPVEQQDRLEDVVLAFVRSPLFIERRVP